MQSLPGVPAGVMNKIMAGTGDAMGKISHNFEVIASNLEELRENQNQQMRALATIYDLLVELAKKQGSKIPEPHIDMSIEEAD